MNAQTQPHESTIPATRPRAIHLLQAMALTLVASASTAAAASDDARVRVCIGDMGQDDSNARSFNGNDWLCGIHYDQETWDTNESNLRTLQANSNGTGHYRLAFAMLGSQSMCARIDRYNDDYFNGVQIVGEDDNCPGNPVEEIWLSGEGYPIAIVDWTVKACVYDAISPPDCEGTTPRGTVAIRKGQLPIPGGDGATRECLSAATQSGTIAHNGEAGLAWQSDGNLVLYDAQGNPKWASNTVGSTHLCFQSDGNLVTYATGSATWGLGTNPDGETLILQNDCNLVMYNGNGQALFGAGTDYCG